MQTKAIGVALAAVLLAAGGCAGEPGGELPLPDGGTDQDGDPPWGDGGTEPARDGGSDADSFRPDGGPSEDGGPAEDGGPMGDGGRDAGDGAPAEEDPPITSLDDLRLVINIGDSLAAGYNATGRNDRGGHGYARLLVDNHPDYPEHAGHHLSALFPDVGFRDLGESGATSGDALDNLRGALSGGSLPATVEGDVLVLLTCGGNDFNDDWTSMAIPAMTRAVAATLQGNYREIARLLRERYERPESGRVVVFLVTNVHDPTGGTGSVPAEFDDGFCSTIQRFPGPVRTLAISNLAILNDAIAAVTEEIGGVLVDNHDVFLDHGMNAGADRWIDGDCVHPTSEGHHQLRRRHWEALTGEVP